MSLMSMSMMIMMMMTMMILPLVSGERTDKLYVKKDAEGGYQVWYGQEEAEEAQKTRCSLKTRGNLEELERPQGTQALVEVVLFDGFRRPASPDEKLRGPMVYGGHSMSKHLSCPLIITDEQLKQLYAKNSPTAMQNGDAMGLKVRINKFPNGKVALRSIRLTRLACASYWNWRVDGLAVEDNVGVLLSPLGVVEDAAVDEAGKTRPLGFRLQPATPLQLLARWMQWLIKRCQKAFFEYSKVALTRQGMAMLGLQLKTLLFAPMTLMLLGTGNVLWQWSNGSVLLWLYLLGYCWHAGQLSQLRQQTVSVLSYLWFNRVQLWEGFLAIPSRFMASPPDD